MNASFGVMQDSMKREQGGKVQRANIQAAKVSFLMFRFADIIRTTLGPRSMLKMLLDAAGGIVVTNDGNAILRELDLAHPAAKSMIELSRTQDEEIWDSYAVKAQALKTAIEAACLLLRIDDIVSGIKNQQAPGAGGPSKPKIEEEGEADNDQLIPE